MNISEKIMEKLRNYLYRRPVSSILILIVIELLIVQMPMGALSKYLWALDLKEVVLAGIALFFVYLVNGKGEVVYSSTGIGYAFKKCWWAFIIAILIGGITLVGSIASHTSIVDYPLVIFLLVVFFCLLVGLFEESLFRGLFLNALLVKNGNTFKGLLYSVIITSILFGFVHVAPNLIVSFSDPSSLTVIAIGQMICKTIQSGMLGFVLAAVYLRNHNLWSVAIIHGLNDLIMLAPNYLFNVQNVGNYVQSDNGPMQILVYLIVIVLSLPLVIIGYRILKRLPLPQLGFFKVCWFPLDMKNKK